MITTIKEFRKLNERLDITNVIAKDKDDLINLINYNMREFGNECNLNFIDTSNITDMSGLFKYSEFNGYIDEWNTSKVITMFGMFYKSEFNQDISEWNTSKVTNISSMFRESQFNQDISNWDVSNIKNMNFVFYENTAFNHDLEIWKLHPNCDTYNMFDGSKLKTENNLPSWYKTT